MVEVSITSYPSPRVFTAVQKPAFDRLIGFGSSKQPLFENYAPRVQGESSRVYKQDWRDRLHYAKWVSMGVKIFWMGGGCKGFRFLLTLPMLRLLSSKVQGCKDF